MQTTLARSGRMQYHNLPQAPLAEARAARRH